jgi:hypothetical protein
MRRFLNKDRCKISSIHCGYSAVDVNNYYRSLPDMGAKKSGYFIRRL